MKQFKKITLSQSVIDNINKKIILDNFIDFIKKIGFKEKQLDYFEYNGYCIEIFHNKFSISKDCGNQNVNYDFDVSNIKILSFLFKKEFRSIKLKKILSNGN